MARTAAPRETMSERIDYLVNLTKGKMPITMIVKSEAEADEARKLLKKRKNVGNISVKVETK